MNELALKAIDKMSFNHFAEPKELTHLLNIKVLSKDGSVKEINIRYCHSDVYINSSGVMNNAQTIAKSMLKVICKDSMVNEVHLSLFELKNMQKVVNFQPIHLGQNVALLTLASRYNTVNN